MAAKKKKTRLLPRKRQRMQTIIIPDEDDNDYQSETVKESVNKDDFNVEIPIAPALKTEAAEALPRRIFSLDNRKLSNKDKAKLAIWCDDRRGKALDAFFRGQAERARARFGSRAVFVGSEADALVVTIPMFGGHGPNTAKYPGCLPMEFIFAMDGFPLGLIIQLVSKHGTGKSALLAEFGRWFFEADGGMNLCEAETKFNPNWYRSIMSSEFFEMMPLYRCKSTEDWQRKLTFAYQSTQIDMDGTKENPGPGRNFPILYGVDSIMGKASEETQEQILGRLDKRTGRRGITGDGAASRGFPIEALKITRYMRTIPGDFDEWPFSLVLVNHLRIRNDEQGNPERSKAGGEQVNFQESFELELRKIGGHKKMISCVNFDGYPVEISCEKNSFGPTHRRIQTRVLWWEEEDDSGGWQQRTIWDWDWSTVHLLHNLMHGERANPRLKQSLKDIDFHLECPSTAEIENLAWSRNLGMTKKDAAPWSEVGALIREDAALLVNLRKALRINNRPLLRGDYRSQIETLAEELP